MVNTNHSLLPVPVGNLQVSILLLSGGDTHYISHPAQTTEPVHLSLIVPTYNESGNIEKIVQILSNLLDKALPNDYELIIVDDDSPDRTWDLAKVLMSDYPHLRVMRRQTERGLSTAVIRGWQAAKGEILGVIDGDLQHPPEITISN